MKKIVQAMCAGVATLSVAVSALAGEANPNNYPSRPITLVVPYGAGGLTDVVIRKLAQQMEKSLGQSIVIQNRGGANGTLGAVAMRTAAPDGYNLAIIPGGVFRIPYIQPVDFDPVKDLSYISGIADYSYLIAVRSDSSWKGLKDLLAAAKANPGKYIYGSPGVYSTPQMTFEDVLDAAGGKMVHVPFKGGTDNVNALLGGHVDVIVGGGSGTLAQLVQEGRIRILATMNGQRGSDYPDAPTVRELGFNAEARSPIGLVGPKGLEPSIIARVDAAVSEGVKSAEFVELMKSVGMPITYMGPKEYDEYAENTFREEGVRMTRVLALEGKKVARAVPDKS